MINSLLMWRFSIIQSKFSSGLGLYIHVIFLLQSPSMGRRAAPEIIAETDNSSSDLNGDASAESRATLTSAQRLAVSATSSSEVAPETFGVEAKHFTEIRVLNRDVSHLILIGILFFQLV